MARTGAANRIAKIIMLHIAQAALLAVAVMAAWEVLIRGISTGIADTFDPGRGAYNFIEIEWYNARGATVIVALGVLGCIALQTRASNINKRERMVANTGVESWRRGHIGPDIV
jgi:hypothetical protein